MTRGRPLLHIFDLTAIGLIVTDKKRLEGRRKFSSIEITLLIRLHVCSAFPQTYCKAGVLILRILQEPSPAKPLDVTPFVATVALYVFSNSFHEPGRSFPHVIRMIMSVPPAGF